MSRSPWFRRLSLIATLLTLVVVVLGAYVRLSDAGLGCPDWPGCYGQISVPDAPEEIASANAAYPDRPVEAAKGWKEMVHRYVAGTLGLLVFALAVLAWRNRREPGQPLAVPLALVAVIVFQALLGMWTVTWKLKPLIVMAHLLGGLTTLSLLTWQTLRVFGGAGALRLPRGWRVALVAALALLAGQIALGGWTSANYAALACNEFPACTPGEVWPEVADFPAGFDPWHGIGPDYEYGTHLSRGAKVAIHLAHRAGAVVVFLALFGLGLALIRRGGLAAAGGAALAAGVTAQFALGVSNVLFSLPLGVAVAHNAGAAILLAVLVALNHFAHPSRLS
ncbi:Heme A synthase [wastewater metagenome]|uniref:Heme A synthase n=2 Tax=unclassified sequences TaxID=12908 RepID=A0A5B8RB42_9ZZZZ|nr:MULTISPECIES: COX15/CtaA family protein [Arhodomonas]MCS4505321.1 COX15/CtaA family protein [Arhodomonas aquaeolei]QEA06010.1 heme A synthase [uncultured organism]